LNKTAMTVVSAY